VTWTAVPPDHTARAVPLYATGPGSRYVAGTLDNTDIYGVMAGPPLAPGATRRFQQGVNGYAGGRDTQIRQDAPDTSYGTQTVLMADLDDNTATGNQPVQPMVRFDDLFGAGAGQVPAGARITSAKLIIQNGSASDAGSSTTTSVYRMLAPWDESATWNSMGGGISANGIQASGSADVTITPESVGGTMVLDVTPSVQVWANGLPNYGLVLLANGTNGWRWNSNEATDASARPALEITYVLA
jgi:hypothetical protein